ncbi:MAG: succinate dehydrogenase, cytochrome b556 subunit [Chloroflexota bacterium]
MIRLPNQLRYRPREGMIAWAFHRISGIGIFAFVLLHVLDIYLVGGNPKLYDEVLAFYSSIPGRFLEVLLGAALLYHSLNGLRIIIIDLWPRMTAYQRVLWWATWVIFIVAGVPGAIIILRPVWLPILQQLGLG